MTLPVLARHADDLDPERLGRVGARTLARERQGGAVTTTAVLPREARGEVPVELVHRLVRLAWPDLHGTGPVRILDAVTGTELARVSADDALGAVAWVDGAALGRPVLLQRARERRPVVRELDQTLVELLVGAPVSPEYASMFPSVEDALAGVGRMLFGAAAGEAAPARPIELPVELTETESWRKAYRRLVRSARDDQRALAAHGSRALREDPPSPSVVWEAFRSSCLATAAATGLAATARRVLAEVADRAGVERDTLWTDAVGGEPAERVRWPLEVAEAVREEGSDPRRVARGECADVESGVEWAGFLDAFGADFPDVASLSAPTWLESAGRAEELLVRSVEHGPPSEAVKRGPEDPDNLSRQARRRLAGARSASRGRDADMVEAWLGRGANAHRRRDDLHFQARWLVGALRHALPDDVGANDLRGLLT